MKIPFISSAPPAIGSRVTVWFDKKGGDLILETDAGQRSRSIYGVCLRDAVFATMQTARGSSRCIARGAFLAVPGTQECLALQREILRAANGHLEFYWWRDKRWPIKEARLAFIDKPHGGFPTSAVVDAVAD